jgi:DNA replication and repair protein RecF
VTLSVERIRLENFRSYQSLEMEPGKGLTIIVGPNAVGKTNIIEAIQLLTAASSFRNPSWAECVRWGESEATLALEAEGDGRRLEHRLTIADTGRRTYSANGNVKRRLSDFTGTLPSVVFTPDDLRMVKDAADKRRAAIDGVGDQLSPAYMALRGEYDKTLRQRNAALKGQTVDEEVVGVLTEGLVVKGEAFSTHRQRLFGRLSKEIAEIYSSLVPGETLEAIYESSWSGCGLEGGGISLEEALRLSHPEERARRTTVVGPHRDEIRFLLNGRDARVYASQGQQRTIALAWKLAEVSVITGVGGQPPILLLDDVMSELDEARRHTLASFVGKVTQAFATTTNLGYFEQEMIARAHIVRLG